MDRSDLGAALPRPEPRRGAGERMHEWVQWFGAGRLAASALAVIAVAVGGWWLVRVPPPPTEATLPYAAPPSSGAVADATTAPSSTSAAASVFVHVAGAVAAPGVYELLPSARVIDAVTAAGGAVAEADTNQINLAAPVADGQRVYVPKMGEAPPPAAGGPTAPGAGAAPAGPINVNTATSEQLDTLPGVGPATAAAIVSHREQHGPFSSVDALGDVRGIGPAKLDALRGLVTV
jgi:competence protein ComEA